MADLIKAGYFLQTLVQRFIDLFTLKPYFEIACNSIDEPLLLGNQEWLVFGVEHTYLAAGFIVGADLRLQLLPYPTGRISDRKASAIEFDHGSGNVRKLHGGYQMFENLLADI